MDGDYNSARLLPEMTAYGAGQLYNSKYFGLSGMEALRAVLKHANQYGLKYIFVRDRYYEPLLAFAGWRQAETYDNGNVTLWTKEDVPPAQAAGVRSASCPPKCRESCGAFCRWQQPAGAVPGSAAAGATPGWKHSGISRSRQRLNR